MHVITKSEAERLGIVNVRKAVTEYARELKAWIKHMEKVGVDPAYQAYPGPTTHEIIMKAVDEDGNIVYEYVDDSLTISKEVVKNRKLELFGLVSQAEEAEIAKLIPPGKQRLHVMKENAIIKKDGELRTKIVGDHATRKEEVDFVKLEKHIEEMRGEEATAFLKDYADKKEKAEAIRFWGASLHADIEDLSDEEVFNWKVPSYQG